MIQRWYSIGVAVIVAQLIWVIAFFMSRTPLHAAVTIVGLVAGISVMLFPQFGVLLLSGLLIGQWPANIVSYLGVLTLGSALIWLLLHRQPIMPRNAILFLTICYFALGVLSLVNPKTTIELRSHLLALTGHCSFVWLFATLVTTRAAILRVLQWMVASGVVTAIIGLVQWKTHFVWVVSTTSVALSAGNKGLQDKTALDLQGWQGQFRIDSITGTPDFLPLYMQSLSPFVALWIIRQKTWGRRVAGLAVLALFALAHVLSFTRGALLTTAAVAVLSAWTIDRKRLIAYGPIVAIMLFVVMLSWSPLRGRMLTFLSLESKESRETVNTGGWRLRTIPVALQLISERPFFGLGLGQQRWNWPENTFGDLIPDPSVVDPLPIHNDYLLIPAELGVGGGIVLVLLIAVAVRKLDQIATYFRDRGDLELSHTATATWLAILGIAMAMTMYPIVDSFRYFWLLLAVTAALMRICSDTSTAVRAVAKPESG